MFFLIRYGRISLANFPDAVLAGVPIPEKQVHWITTIYIIKGFSFSQSNSCKYLQHQYCKKNWLSAIVIFVMCMQCHSPHYKRKSNFWSQFGNNVLISNRAFKLFAWCKREETDIRVGKVVIHNHYFCPVCVFSFTFSTEFILLPSGGARRVLGETFSV